jgi:hypothetical protein
VETPRLLFFARAIHEAALQCRTPTQTVSGESINESIESAR